ncbi:MAG TPA: TetR/AcrR family transcriptional regulator [Vicinamibacterales bacterium]|nr:TetR/AcrR family transcriptional regulator [Vicinamibacterales bacterium]
MSKGNTRSSESSHAAIFAAAAEEFSERGFEAGGVDRIASKARVNKAMLYYHFGSKRALYIEVLRDMFRAVSAKARGIADGPGTAPEKLERWVATIIQEAAARPWFPPIMLRELASGAPRLDPDTFAVMNSIYGAVRDILLQGQREGSFGELDPLLTHLTIMPPILIFFARQRVLATKELTTGLLEPRQIEAFVAHMQRTALRLVQKEGPRPS